MEKLLENRWVRLGAAGLALWLGVKYLLPVLLPFILGGALALAAEPLVRLTGRRIKRPVAAGIGVCTTLVLALGALALLGSLAVRELESLSHRLPDIQQTVTKLHSWLDKTAARAPEGLRGFLQQTVDAAFSSQSSVAEPVAEKLPKILTDFLLWLPRGAVTLFTALVSAFMISARLPQLKEKLPASWREKYLPALARLRRGFWGWLKAQLKLMAITATVLTLGFLVLGVDYAPLVAALIALVDAVPILGTGTVLLPWALVCVLQKNTALALGLLSLYLLALTVRTVLEPRLIGKQLGLDPLLTLVAFYVGFSLWGFLGMLLAPVLATAVGTIAKGN